MVKMPARGVLLLLGFFSLFVSDGRTQAFSPTSSTRFVVLNRHWKAERERHGRSVLQRSMVVQPYQNGDSSPYLRVGQASTTTTRNNNPAAWKTDCATLFRMTRPSHIPGTVLFHLLGVFLVLRRGLTMLPGTTTNYWAFLLGEPALWLTLLSTNLVCASSMVVNDYFDAKLGRDTLELDKNMLTNGSISKAAVKRFLQYMYGAALVVCTLLPGAPTRLTVTTSLIVTYLYTEYLKPLTWAKNAVCASLIALAPLFSGLSALHLLIRDTGTTAAASAVNGCVPLFMVPELWCAFTILFTGTFGREILMDCIDLAADEAAGIRTVPVVYGKLFAVKVVGLLTIPMTLAAVVLPLRQIVQLPSSILPLRRLLLASIASGAHLRNIWKVWMTRAKDNALINKTVNDAYISVVGLMASIF